MYDVSAQGVDERMINVYYYYYLCVCVCVRACVRACVRVCVCVKGVLLLLPAAVKHRDATLLLSLLLQTVITLPADHVAGCHNDNVVAAADGVCVLPCDLHDGL